MSESSRTKRVAWVVVVLALTLILGLFFVVLTAQKRLKATYAIHIPVLEHNAISLRLVEHIGLNLETMVHKRDLSKIELIELDRGALEENISAMKEIMQQNKNYYEFVLRSDIRVIEDQIIEDVRSGNWTSASSRLQAKEFRDKQANYVEGLKRMTFRLSRQRSDWLRKQNIEIKLAISTLVAVTLLLILSLWWLIRRYQESVRMRIETEKKLESQRAKMMNSARLASLGEMAGGIAHEINNPLTIVQGYAELLQMASQRDQLLPKERMDNIVRSIFDTTQRISNIVKGLRNFSRDGSKDEFVEYSLQTLIEDSTSLCKEKIISNGVDLKIEGETELNLYCQPVQLSQVLINLLNNSYNAVKELKEPWIKIEVIKDRGLYVKVSDNGPGVPEEIADRIFDPFFTTKDIGHGTGLGLSISKGIVENHSGSLQLDSSLPNTTFIIRLPASLVRENEPTGRVS